MLDSELDITVRVPVNDFLMTLSEDHDTAFRFIVALEKEIADTDFLVRLHEFFKKQFEEEEKNF